MMQELARRKEEALKEAQVKEVKHSLLSYNNNNNRNRRSMSNILLPFLLKFLLGILFYSCTL